MRIRPCVSVSLLVLLSAAALGAQEQWTVTIRLTSNPLPIGTCHTVSLTVYDPVTKGNARNASGGYVSAADFDMGVESEGNPAAVGKYEGTAWSACACQSGTVGQRGIITATYPAKAINEGSRVAGVAFKSQVPFTFSEPQSKYNAAGCDALKNAAVSPTRPVAALPPTSPPVTLAPAPSPGAPPAGVPLTPAGLAPPPPSTPTAMVMGPQNFRVSPVSPVLQILDWDLVPGVAGYNVYVKRDAAFNDWTLATRKPLLTRTFADSAVRQPGTMYRVTALYGDGRQGSTDIAYANPPQMQVPTGFKATGLPNNQVSLEWFPVAAVTANGFPVASKVKGYRIFGAEMPPGGMWVDTTTVPRTGLNIVRKPWIRVDVPSLPYGKYSWQVTADYGGAYQTAGLPTATVTLFDPCNPPLQATPGTAPDWVRLSQYAQKIAVEWAAVNGAVAYTVEREDYTGFGQPILLVSTCTTRLYDRFGNPGNVTVYFVDGSGGLVVGSSYRYRVTAFNSAGQRGSKTGIWTMKAQ